MRACFCYILSVFVCPTLCLCSIGNVLDIQGKPEEALAMHQKSLDIKLKVFGPDHPLSADTKCKYAHPFFYLNSIFDGIDSVFGPAVSAASPSFSYSKRSTARPSSCAVRALLSMKIVTEKAMRVCLSSRTSSPTYRSSKLLIWVYLLVLMSVSADSSAGPS